MAAPTLARAVLLALATAPNVLWAQTLDYTTYVGVEHSNNVTLSHDHPISQNEVVPGLDFTYRQQGAAVQADVAGILEYRDYLGSQFDSLTQTQLAGRANWSVLPGRLDFSVQDYAGVQPVNSLSSDSPSNQQQTNTLALGPTLHFQAGAAMHGQVELRYINSYASKTDDFNSSRGMAAVRLFRDISPTDQLSLNVETQRVAFTSNKASQNYVRNEAYARYTTQLSRFDAAVLVGASQIDWDHLPSDSSPLAQVTLNWRPSVRSTFSFDAAYRYADAAQDLMQMSEIAPGDTVAGANAIRDVSAGGGLNTGNIVVSSEAYLERRLDVGYMFNSERLSLSIMPLYRKLHYLNDPTFDQRGRGGSLSIDYRLSPTSTLTAYAVGEKLDYQTIDRRDSTVRYGLAFSQQWTSHWSCRASAERQQRNSNVDSQSYRENRVAFNVVYRR